MANICADLFCLSNKGRSYTPLEILEKFIYDGNPPEMMSVENNNKGETHTVFRWEDSGHILRINYNPDYFIVACLRFREFWGSCTPKTKMIFKEYREG